MRQNKILTAGYLLLLFLPVIESFNRAAALSLLFIASLLISHQVFRNRFVRIDLINTLFILFIVWAFFTSIHSWSLSRSLLETSRYLSYFLIFVTIREIEILKSGFLKFYGSFVLLNTFVLSIVFALFTFMPFLTAPTDTGLNLFFPVFGHNRISAMLIFAIPLLLAKKADESVNQNSNWHNTAIVYSVFLLLLSFGRGAWWSLSGGIFLSFILFTRFRKSLLRLFLIFMSASIFLTGLIYINSHFFTSQERGSRIYTGLFKPVNNEKRMEYFKQAFLSSVSSPIIGTGLDTFRFVSKKLQEYPYSWSWYAHNHFLQIFSDTGIPGGLLFLGLFMMMTVKAFKNTGSTGRFNGKTLVFITLLPTMLHTLIDYDWQFISILLLVFSGFGYIAGKPDSEKKLDIRIIYIFASVLFLAVSVSYRDSDAFLSNKNIPEDILRSVEGTDAGYNEISKRLAYLNFHNKSYREAHRYFRKSIILDPLESENEIRADYILYLTEASEANDFKLILTANRIYPYFPEKSKLKPKKENDLKQYIREMIEFTGYDQIRIADIKKILKTPYFIN